VTRAARVAAAACLAVSAVASTARAQGASADTPRLGTWEISGGAAWSSSIDLGSRSADETRNPGTGTGTFSLFQSRTEVGSVVGASLKLGMYLSHAVAIEAGGLFQRPVVSTHVSADAEDAPALDVEETLTRIIVDGSLVLDLGRLAFAGGRGVPFAVVGAGYLRELHENNEYIETGQTYHAGGGVKYWVGQRFGVRADIAASVRDGGFHLGQKRRTLAVAALSAVYRF